MQYNVGDRVGAILEADRETVKFFGYGTYQGEEVPDENCGGFMAAILRYAKQSNPKIALDSGEIVWGCECWWGTEKEVKASIGNRTIIIVSLAEQRERALFEAFAYDEADPGSDTLT